MEILDLQLSAPNVHLLPDSSDQAEAPPITGYVAVAVPLSTPSEALPSIPQVAISLMRHVKLNEFHSTIPPHQPTRRHTIRFWKQAPPSRQKFPTARQACRAQSQIIARHHICHVPDEIGGQAGEGRASLKFNFHVPITDNCAASIDTVGGSIAYTIEATISTPYSECQRRQLHASQPVRIVRFAKSNTISHLRRYPGDSVTTELYVAPSCTQNEVAYSLQWLARSTVSRGARPSEVKYVVAKELLWSVEETIKCLAVTVETTTCLHQYTRRLSEGRLKGRWVANGESQDRDDSIQIPLKVAIPPDINASDTTTLAFNQGHHSLQGLDTQGERLAITVDHQLNLEVVTGEDTFHRETGDLLDRRYPVKSFRTTFPLLVRQHVCDDLSSSVRKGETPPVYEEPYVGPPGYEDT